MPKLAPRLSARFLAEAAECPLATARRARTQIDMLLAFPDMGRLADNPTITSRLGDGVRTLVCDSYLLVYRHNDDVVEVLALFPARLVR